MSARDAGLLARAGAADAPGPFQALGIPGIVASVMVCLEMTVQRP